jgi:hypothetical protein
MESPLVRIAYPAVLEEDIPTESRARRRPRPGLQGGEVKMSVLISFNRKIAAGNGDPVKSRDHIPFFVQVFEGVKVEDYLFRPANAGDDNGVQFNLPGNDAAGMVDGDRALENPGKALFRFGFNLPVERISPFSERKCGGRKGQDQKNNNGNKGLPHWI